MPLIQTHSKKPIGYCLMNYTVQCMDVQSGKTGCFVFDEEYYIETGKFKAIGEVFEGLHGLYLWSNRVQRETGISPTFSRYTERF